MLAPYRSVLATPGAMAFCAAGLLSRLPISTMTLGIVLLVEAPTGSYGFAGAVSATYMVGAAVVSPAMARLIDRLGQHRVLLPAYLAFALSLVWLVLALELGWHDLFLYCAAAVAGVAYPPVGACIRARWSSALGAGPALHTAFSIESMVDELIFILGPVLVTVLAIQAHPALALLAVAGLASTGGWWLSTQRATEPPVRGVSRGSHVSRLPWAWLAPMTLAAACLGSLFGSTEVVTVAFAEEQGATEVTGLLLAGWAAGSLIAGFVTGAVQWAQSALQRYRWGTLGLAAAVTPLPFVDNLWALGVALFVAGFAISPTVVATMSLVEATVPAGRLTEGISWVSTGIAFGIAPGAAVAGRLVDGFGASTGFVVPVVGGVLAALIAWSTGQRHVSADHDNVAGEVAARH
ncbi:MAG: MFS transporter [Nocardioidaceae bacterium]|nr:MFS transporter [Nocardioidaceae bacterium]